jgi:hypothetical protein
VAGKRLRALNIFFLLQEVRAHCSLSRLALVKNEQL